MFHGDVPQQALKLQATKYPMNPMWSSRIPITSQLYPQKSSIVWRVKLPDAVLEMFNCQQSLNCWPILWESASPADLADMFSCFRIRKSCAFENPHFKEDRYVRAPFRSYFIGMCAFQSISFSYLYLTNSHMMWRNLHEKSMENP